MWSHQYVLAKRVGEEVIHATSRLGLEGTHPLLPLPTIPAGTDVMVGNKAQGPHDGTQRGGHRETRQKQLELWHCGVILSTLDN